MNGDRAQDDQMQDMLAQLSVHDIDPGSTERIRRRCHAVLSGSKLDAERGIASWRTARFGLLGLILVGGGSLVFLVEVLRRALQLHNL